MKVLKPYNLPFRRLKPGDEISEHEIIGPIGAEGLVDLGVLESDAPRSKKAASKHGDEK